MTAPPGRADVETTDVLVVGGGPAGTATARGLCERGFSVVLVEEHPEIGRPVQCAGLVSSRVLELAGSSSMVLRPVRGATVFGPSLRSISFRAEEPRAYVLDRAALDVHLAERAVQSGVDLRVRTRFDRLAEAPNGRAVAELTGPEGNRCRIAARLVVGADGVSSAVARAFRLRRPVEILPAFEAEYAESPGDPDSVEVYLGRSVAPGLFGWWIPDGHGGARVGVAADADGVPARTYFLKLVERLATRFGRPLATPRAYLASGIPIGEVPRLHGPRVLLVGDAAAQVKPLSGGGIYTALRAAALAAEVASEALRLDDLSAARLARYTERWRAELGEEFRRALYLRRVFTRLSDDDLDAVVEALGAGGLAETIVAFGDIDFPTHVVGELLRSSPSLVRLLPKALGAWVAPRAPYLAPDLEAGGLRK